MKNDRQQIMAVLDAHMATIRELSAQYGAARKGDILEERVKIMDASDVRDIVSLYTEGLQQEQFHILMLNTRQEVIDRQMLYQGTVNSSQVRVAEVFRQAIIQNAKSIIIAHNHPSGDPTPSPDDRRTTRQIISAGKILDIAVLDHVVLGADGTYTSLRDMDTTLEWTND